MRILITGGAGFVGSNLAIFLKQDFPKAEISCLDNLKRRGSELNLNRLKQHKINFIHGDIRNKEDLNFKDIDYLLECSADPSVLSGYDSPEYIINTNLVGTLNCLEVARRNNSVFIFLSTSRVYPSTLLNFANIIETDTRFKFDNNQKMPGLSQKGISEKFPMMGARSFYGATKYASEIMINEYIDAFNLKAVINRCSVISGPWQMGKIDQGIVALWVARHFFQQKLNYIGFKGSGKQVRDILHINDLYTLVKLQIKDIDTFSGQTFNVGGGLDKSISLLELTKLCEEHTGNKINIGKIMENRKQDIPVYISNNTKIEATCNWKPVITVDETVKDIVKWIDAHKNELEPILK